MIFFHNMPSGTLWQKKYLPDSTDIMHDMSQLNAALKKGNAVRGRPAALTARPEYHGPFEGNHSI